MDMRGHGNSDGPIAYIPSLDECVKDFNQFFELTLQKYYKEESEKEEPLPIFLVGNSFGCMVCLEMLL